MKQVFVLLFQRLSSTKTTKFVKGLIVFFAYYVIRYGASSLVTIVDEIQPQWVKNWSRFLSNISTSLCAMLTAFFPCRMFGMVVERVILADLQKVSGEIERKVAAVGMSNLLIDCPAMVESPYNVFYPRLLATLVEFFELPRDETILPEDGLFPDVDDSSGYQAAYSQLICARNPKKDPLEGKLIQSIREFLSVNFHDFFCTVNKIRLSVRFHIKKCWNDFFYSKFFFNFWIFVLFIIFPITRLQTIAKRFYAKLKIVQISVNFHLILLIFWFFSAIGDVRLHLAQGLGRLPPGQLPGLLGQIPEPNAIHLRNYLQTAGISVA